MLGQTTRSYLRMNFTLDSRQRRASSKDYDELLHEFMCAVKQNYGERVLIQFEDFANHNAFKLLARYRKTHLVFNDDIHGTSSVVLAGLIAALKLVGGTLAEHTFVFLGAGEAGTGIAELVAFEISRQTIKPTVLVGSAGVGKTFTKEVIEIMTSFNERPVILALSNPTPQSECTAEEAYIWSKVNIADVFFQGRAIFASGSPFSPVQYEGKTYVTGQANNAYVFPGFGLGLVISGAIRVHDDMLLAASEALAQQVKEEDLEKGLIYPPFSKVRKISSHIAAKVAEKVYELGLASHLPSPENLVKYVENCMYSPIYRKVRNYR